MKLTNIVNILSHINEHEIKDNKITIVNTENKKLMVVKDVISVFITEEDNWSTLNFEVLGHENGICNIDIALIDSYDTDKQEIKLGL